jgi:hypothetical protein
MPPATPTLAALSPEWRTLLAPAMHRLHQPDSLVHNPYPHLSLHDFFSRKLYDQIIEHFPRASEHGWMQSNNTARCRRAGLCEQWGIGSSNDLSKKRWPFADWHLPQGSERRRFWAGFHEAVNSEEMLTAWVYAFASTIHLRYQQSTVRAHRELAEHINSSGIRSDPARLGVWAKRLVRKANLKMEMGLRRSAPGYALEPHTDMCAKLVSSVLMLPDDENSAEGLPGSPRYPRAAATMRNRKYARLEDTPYGDGGTAVYVPTIDARLNATSCGQTDQTFHGYREVKRAPYVHNTLFAFSTCATSWHGVASSKARRSIFFFVAYRGTESGRYPLQAACPLQQEV